MTLTVAPAAAGPAPAERTSVPVQVRRADGAESVAAWVAGAATVAAVIAHAVNRASVGGLWRDEQNLIATADAATWAEWRRLLPFETSAPLCSLALRGMMACGITTTDGVVRWVGLGVGLALVATTWLVVRRVGRTVPLATMALMAVSPTVVRYGDSARQYGLGTLLALTVIAAFYGFISRPSPTRWGLALVASVAAVQVMYGNAAVVVAATLAAIVASANRRVATAAIGVAVASAASLLVEVPIFSVVSDYVDVFGGRVPPSFILTAVFDALGGSALQVFALAIVTIATVATATVALRPQSDAAGCDAAGGGDRLALRFELGALAALLVTYPAFLMASKFAAQFPWHVLPLLYVGTALLDVVRGRTPPSKVALAGALRVALIVACGVACAAQVLSPETWSRLTRRATNVDLLARALARAAGPHDLIVLASWYRGISFGRYYTGATPWVSLPPLADVRVHRQDLVMAMLRRLDANPPPDGAPPEVRALIDRIATTVRAGGRVWCVGEMVPPGPLRPLPRPSQAQRPWHDQPYFDAWLAGAEQAVRDAGGEWVALEVKGAERADPYEWNRLLCGKLPQVPALSGGALAQ